MIADELPVAALPPIADTSTVEEIAAPELPPLDETIALVKKTKAARAAVRNKAHAILALKVQGHNREEIANLLQLSMTEVRGVLFRMRRAGKIDDLRDVLEHDSAALAVESLNFHLKNRNKKITIETLKGLGRFRKYGDPATALMGAGTVGMPALHVTIINAPNQGGQQQVVSAPIGTPRTDEP